MEQRTHAGKARLWRCDGGTEPHGYVAKADRRTVMKASVPLLAAILSCAALGATSLAAPAPVLVSQTQQQRSDRVVGYWTSSSGVGITLAYTGKPETLWIQVFPKPRRADPRLDYTAQWSSNDRFTYTDLSGSTVEGRVSASGNIIELKGADGWTGTWRRNR